MRSHQRNHAQRHRPHLAPHRPAEAGRITAIAAVLAVVLITTTGLITVVARVTSQKAAVPATQQTAPTPTLIPTTTSHATSPTTTSHATTPTTTSHATAQSSTPSPCATAAGRGVRVANARQLTRTLAAAKPGQVIHLADGTYTGEFRIATSGTADLPIALCGTRRALLRGQGIDEGYGLHLANARFWLLSGFTVTEAQKGIVLDRSSSNRLTGLAVTRTGHEAVHLRTHSTDNVLERSEINDTGLKTAKFGEGVYVGSAVSNWCEYTACEPDTSDRNQILGNRIGPGTGAEAVDIKEGTTGGTVGGNTFIGTGMDAADSWVDVKGNGWRIEGNTGSDTPEDGFQVHVIRDGWGRDNIFAGNVANLGDGEHGFRIDKEAAGTIVSCDNRVSGASKGISNIDCR